MKGKTYTLRNVNGSIQIESLVPLTTKRLQEIKAELNLDEQSRVIGWRLAAVLPQQNVIPMGLNAL